MSNFCSTVSVRVLHDIKIGDYQYVLSTGHVLMVRALAADRSVLELGFILDFFRCILISNCEDGAAAITAREKMNFKPVEKGHLIVRPINSHCIQHSLFTVQLLVILRIINA